MCLYVMTYRLKFGTQLHNSAVEIHAKVQSDRIPFERVLATVGFHEMLWHGLLWLSQTRPCSTRALHFGCRLLDAIQGPIFVTCETSLPRPTWSPALQKRVLTEGFYEHLLDNILLALEAFINESCVDKGVK